MLKGELNRVTVDNEIFEFVSTLTDQADTALYGRVTYEMMEDYWPTAGEKPNATKHDKEYAVWYKNIPKVVLSTTMKESVSGNLMILSNYLPKHINKLKQQPGKNILIFGSPRASHSLLNLRLIDEYLIFVNPILMGQGIPLFKNVPDKIKLTLPESKTFTSGVKALHYMTA